MTADGEIVTNAHVVGDAETVHVRLNGESEPRDAAVIAVDSSRDLALLRVDAGGLSPAVFAAPDDVRLGDEVLAIGYALDLDGDPTVTLGIVSSLDRTLATETGSLKGLIQTDAAVSSGNSGGPLVNAVGDVAGLITLASSSGLGTTANGLGFAISTAELLPTLDRLRAQANGETAETGYLGVQLARRTDGGSGALVTEVVAGSAAAKAGIKEGDVVVAVDGEPITRSGGARRHDSRSGAGRQDHRVAGTRWRTPRCQRRTRSAPARLVDPVFYRGFVAVKQSWVLEK